MSSAGLSAGNPDGEDPAAKAQRLAARAARFGNRLPGNRAKELEEARILERKRFEEQGLITAGKTELGDAVEMRGTCEDMCSEYERETREFRGEIGQFERRENGRMDPSKAVAAYTRSDAGAGHGEAAKLPSDLRTPGALSRSLTYLITQIMTLQPSSGSRPPTQRRALGNSSGFIRDRTRAIRKEFAMQASWGQSEAIECNERIARWHILCLRELQEESGTNADMHIDNAELGRCFVTLRQLYNDRREETRQDVPSVNEPEFRAYMLIYDLAQKSTAILTSELPSAILDDPLVKIAFELHRAAQRNFDSQKEGSKFNAELGMNMITRFLKLLKQPNVPFLFSALVEVRLREMRRSALRALKINYLPLKSDPVLYGQNGQKEYRMILLEQLNKCLGCEEQETDEPAFDDVDPVPRTREQEACDIARRFGVEIYEEGGAPVGVLINRGTAFNDNEDAPYTRRWKLITDKRGDMSFVDIVHGRAGTSVDPSTVVSRKMTSSFPTTSFRAPSQSTKPAPAVQLAPIKPSVPSFFSNVQSPSAASASTSASVTPAFSFGKASTPVLPPAPAVATTPSFSFGAPASIAAKPAASPAETIPPAAAPTFTFPSTSKTPSSQPTATSKPSFFDNLMPSTSSSNTTPTPTPVPSAQQSKVPSTSFFDIPKTASTVAQPAAPVFALPKPPSPPKTPTLPTAAASLSSKALGKQPVHLAVSLRRSQRVTEEQRVHHRSALPALLDDMLQGSIRRLMDEFEEDRALTVRIETAVRAHAAAQKQRETDIELYANVLLNSMIKEETRLLTREATLYGIRTRIMMRKVGKFWRSWARARGREKEQRKKDQEEMYGRMNTMGLGGSRAVSVVLHEGGKDEVGLGDMGTDHGDLGADVMLRESARQNDHFHAPSTFLSIVAQCVGEAYGEPSDHREEPASPGSHTSYPRHTSKNWQTIISTSAKSATPPNEEATKWLTRKFSPSNDEDFERYGLKFETEVVGRYDESLNGTSVGLVVFEVPLRPELLEEIDANIQDAHDRLKALARAMTGPQNKYSPILLLVSWNGETLQEITKTLDLEGALDSFDNVGVLSLNTDDPDAQVEAVMEGLVERSEPRSRLYVDMRDVTEQMSEGWNRWLAVVAMISHQDKLNDPAAVLDIVKAGIQAFNGLDRLVRGVLGPIDWDASTTYRAIKLPLAGTDLTELTKSIVDHLGSHALVLLLASILHSTTTPLAQLYFNFLASLGNVVIGILATQYIALEHFCELDQARTIQEGFRKDILVKWNESIDQAISKIVPPPAPARPSTPSHADASPSRGSKRGRDSPEETNAYNGTESKAAKNARLLKAIGAVNATLNGRDARDMQRIMA